MKKLWDVHLMVQYYANDPALIAPLSNGIQKLITEGEYYAEVYGLKCNQPKRVLLSLNLLISK